MKSPSQLNTLLKMTTTATGADHDLNLAIDAVLGAKPHEHAQQPDYTSSVDACIALIEKHIPNGHWHVGFDPQGIAPYARLSVGNKRLESQAPTVPLALLSVLLKTLIAEGS